MLLFIMLTKIPKMIIRVLASTWGSALTQAAAAAAKSRQPCPTPCDPIDGGPPGSPIPGILQARTLEWVAISFSSAWKWKVKVTSLSRFQLLVTPWTAAHQAPPSMGFSRQEYWSGVPLPSPLTQAKWSEKVYDWGEYQKLTAFSNWEILLLGLGTNSACFDLLFSLM